LAQFANNVKLKFHSNSSNVTNETSLMNLASAAIKNQSFDFSAVKIYTPTSDYKTNQEFISGKVAPVPIPGAVWLFGSGLMGVVGLGRKKNKHNIYTREH